MADRCGAGERLHIGRPCLVGDVRLLPIERISVHGQRHVSHTWFSMNKAPYAIVVRDAGGLRAIGADAAELSLDALRQQVPELDAALASL